MPNDFDVSSSEERILLTTEQTTQALNYIVESCQNQYQTIKTQSSYFFKSNEQALSKYLFSSIKISHNNDDSIFTYLKKSGYNKVVDLVEANFSYLEKGATNLVTAIPEKTLQALDPRNLMICALYSDDVKRYFMQRFDQITTPIQYYQDFRGTWNRRSHFLTYGMQNAYDNFSQIDGSVMNPSRKIVHSGEIIYDLTNGFIAEKLGIFLSVFGLFCLPPVRQKTNQALNQLFPRERFYGKFAQSFPVKFLITKRLAKLYGNPVLSIIIGGYLLGMHVGQHLSDSHKLKQKNPVLFDRLKLMNRDLTNSSFHLNFSESAQKKSIR